MSNSRWDETFDDYTISFSKTAEYIQKFKLAS